MKYVEEVDGATGVVSHYVFPKFSFQLGKLNQWSICIGYWEKSLELEFLRWFLYVDFSSSHWKMRKELEKQYDWKKLNGFI
jgi:hypothetical protein